MSEKFVKDIFFGILFIMLEVLFFQHLSLFGTTVDPLIFFLLWLVPKYERSRLVLIAAILGLIQDAFFDLWGIMMFSKTLLVFIVFNFIKRRSDNQLLLWQIFLFVFGAALIHNIIFMALSSFFTAYATSFYPFLSIVGGAFYTSTVGVLIYIFRVR